VKKRGAHEYGPLKKRRVGEPHETKEEGRGMGEKGRKRDTSIYRSQFTKWWPQGKMCVGVREGSTKKIQVGCESGTNRRSGVSPVGYGHM